MLEETRLDEIEAINAPLLIVIPENEKNIELTLDQLRETKTFADAYGFMPKQFPLEHHVFIQKIIDMANEVDANPTVGTIICPIKDIEKISPTEAESKNLNKDEAQHTRVKVLIARIDLGNESAKRLWNLAIALMYNEKGIEVCVGTNINICGNLTIYGEAKHFRNYGRDGIEMSEMFTQIENWLKDLKGIDAINSDLLQRMERIPIDWYHDSNTFIGQCLKESVRKNYHKGDPFPLTMSQVNKITSYIIDAEKDTEYIHNSIYHLYNAATYVLTHSSELPNMFSNIKEFTHWFEQEWMLPFEAVDETELNKEGIN